MGSNSVAIAQAQETQQQYTSEGFNVSIANMRLLGESVTVQFYVKNTKNVRQYVQYCTVTNIGYASLDTGVILRTDQITGIPSDIEATIRQCLSGVNLDNMAYIESNSSKIVSITWTDGYHRTIDRSASISFPFIMVARTAANPPPVGIPETERPPGPIHAVNIDFTMIPLSGAK
jgi:hypothetical protein